MLIAGGSGSDSGGNPSPVESVETDPTDEGGNGNGPDQERREAEEQREEQQERGQIHTEGEERLPPGLTTCSRTAFANPVTTCGFALNVERAFYASGESSTITAHSNTTGLDYTMQCGGFNPVTCTGGNEAAVYILAE